MTSLWHPFAAMADVDRAGELLLTRGRGAQVWDVEGRDYLDATGGLWFANVGHGREELADAARRQLAELASYSTFGDLATPSAVELADRVAALAPVVDSRVFFTSGGSDSVDTAVKMVRRYWSLVGQPQRRVVVVREKAYHGMHLAGTALAGIDDNRAGYGDLDADVVRVAWDDASALDLLLERLGGTAAAFFCEPVIGAGGVYAAGEVYLRAAREVCAERGVLFVADEVITGFGRVGDWFGSGRFGLAPDLLLGAKGLTSGYVPMGVVVAAPRVWEPFWAPGAPMWRHGYTYSGHATAAAVGLANLAVMADEDLPSRALRLEGRLAEALAPLAAHPAVSEVRAGTGVLAAVQLADPSQGPHAVAALRAEGVLSRGLVGGSLQVSPPLVVSDAQLARLAEAFGRALDRLPVPA